MSKVPGNINKIQARTSKGSAGAVKTLQHLAFNNSLQANLIFTNSTGQLIVANAAACKLLGYSEKELLTKNRVSIFNMTDISFKKMLKQRDGDQSTVVLTAVKRSGKLFSCEVTSAVFTENGIEKAITTITDMSQSILRQRKIDIKKEKTISDDIILAKSKQKKIDFRKEQIVAGDIVQAKAKQKKIDVKKEKIVADNIILAQTKSDEEKIDQEIATRVEMHTAYKENFKLIFHSSPDVLFDSDLIKDEMIISDAYETEFGYKLDPHMGSAASWVNHIHPDDKEALMLDYHSMLLSEATEWKYSYRFLRADNSIANVLSSIIIMRYTTGKAYRMIGCMQDISKQTVLEERLELEIRLKEIQIAEASEDARYAERADIGKELHDNVNQLLGASRLYLDMAKRGGDNSKMYLSRSSEYIILAIEEIRKLTRGLTTDIIRNLGLCEAIDNITRDMMEVGMARIVCNIDFKEDSAGDKFKINIFRIVQEHLNNIIKHAKAISVTIDLSQNENSVCLIITDNGIGFDTNKTQEGIGVANIKRRALSYNGIADFISQPGQGCVLTVIFPETGLLD